MGDSNRQYHAYLVKLYYANCGLSNADIIFARDIDEAKGLYEPTRKRLEEENMAKQTIRPDLNGTVSATFEMKQFPDFNMMLRNKR